jgi:hypothetical protein
MLCVLICVVLVCALSLQGCKTIASAITGYPASFLDYKQTFDNSIGKGCYTVNATSGFDKIGGTSSFELSFDDALGNNQVKCGFTRIRTENSDEWEASLATIITKCGMQVAGEQLCLIAGQANSNDGKVYFDYPEKSRQFLFPRISVMDSYWTGEGEYHEQARFVNIASPERILDPANGLKLSKMTPRYLADDWGVIVTLHYWSAYTLADGEKAFALKDSENMEIFQSEIEPILMRIVDELDYPEFVVELSFGSDKDTVVAYYNGATDSVSWMPRGDYLEQNGLEVCKF